MPHYKLLTLMIFQSMNAYKDLIVWQKAMLIVEEVYWLSSSFPKSELFALSSQMRRAAVSIPSNIAEGYRRKGAKEKGQFYAIAYGSVAELETQIEIALRLAYIEQINCKSLSALLDEVSRMLNKLTAGNRASN